MMVIMMMKEMFLARMMVIMMMKEMFLARTSTSSHHVSPHPNRGVRTYAERFGT